MKKAPASSTQPRSSGFSLIELMVSMVIFALIMGITARLVGDARETWSKASSRVGQFRDARLAFELITRNLSQSTLNTYFDYDDPADPNRYERRSELHFVSGECANILAPPTGSVSGTPDEIRPGHGVFFQAYLGHTETADLYNLGSLLNGRGYYIQFTDGSELIPNFLTANGYPSSSRFRLWEWMPPAEYIDADEPGNLIYAHPTGNAWFETDTELRGENRSRLVAENIIALIISPRSSVIPAGGGVPGDDPWEIAPNYAYDSRNDGPLASRSLKHLLPPLVQVTLVAMDEASAIRLESIHGTAVPNLLHGTPLGSSIFKNPANYESDLEELEEYLAEERINFRVFSTTVALRSAKWDANSF